MKLTRSQRELLRMLRLAGLYRRWVYGGELRTARCLQARGLCTLEPDEDGSGDWFATITAKGQEGSSMIIIDAQAGSAAA